VLSESQQRKVDEILHELEGASAIVDEIRRLNNEQLFTVVLGYNWDSGFAVPQAIADHPDCELATALALFWLSGAVEWLDPTRERNGWEASWRQFSTMLIPRILRGHYQRGSLSFDPGLTRVQRYKLEKAGVPAIFLEPVTST
jgi:hypothetical protein